jgi:hypothetical protein
MKWEKPSKSEDLNAAVRAQKSMTGNDPFWINRAISAHGLHADLGIFRDHEVPYYDMDEHIRDRLIAHARQDAAHALLNTHSIFAELAGIRRRQYMIIVLFISIIVTIIWAVTK